MSFPRPRRRRAPNGCQWVDGSMSVLHSFSLKWLNWRNWCLERVPEQIFYGILPQNARLIHTLIESTTMHFKEFYTIFTPNPLLYLPPYLISRYNLHPPIGHSILPSNSHQIAHSTDIQRPRSSNINIRRPTSPPIPKPISINPRPSKINIKELCPLPIRTRNIHLPRITKNKQKSRLPKCLLPQGTRRPHLLFRTQYFQWTADLQSN